MPKRRMRPSTTCPLRTNITAYTCGTAAGLLLAERAAGVDRSIILPVATKPEQV